MWSRSLDTIGHFFSASFLRILHLMHTVYHWESYVNLNVTINLLIRVILQVDKYIAQLNKFSAEIHDLKSNDQVLHMVHSVPVIQKRNKDLRKVINLAKLACESISECFIESSKNLEQSMQVCNFVGLYSQKNSNG